MVIAFETAGPPDHIDPAHIAVEVHAEREQGDS